LICSLLEIRAAFFVDVVDHGTLRVNYIFHSEPTKKHRSADHSSALKTDSAGSSETWGYGTRQPNYKVSSFTRRIIISYSSSWQPPHVKLVFNNVMNTKIRVYVTVTFRANYFIHGLLCIYLWVIPFLSTKMEAVGFSVNAVPTHIELRGITSHNTFRSIHEC
jgi:hypothetical protein